MSVRRSRLVLAGGALGLLAVCGCSSDPTAAQLAEMNKTNIQRVANIYAGFQNGKGFRGPKDEAEFKQFIRDYDPNKLKGMGIDPGDLDKVFTSERDGKPFKVRYGVGGGMGSVAPVAFEQEGQNGKKQVGFTGGKVEEVDDAEYARLWESKPAAPKGGAGTKSGPPAGPGDRSVGSGRPEGAPKGPPQ